MTSPEGARRELDRRDHLGGVGLAVVAGVSFGTLAISAKLAYGVGADPIPLLTTRFAITAAIVAAFILLSSRRFLKKPRDVARLLLLGGLGYAVESSLFFAALEHAPAGIVGLIFYSYPLWTTLLGLATGLEVFRMRLVVALVLGTAGVALIFSLPGSALLGPALALAAALAVAVYFIVAQVVTRGVDPTAAAMWTAVGAAGALLGATMASGQSMPAEAIPASLAMGAATAVAFIALYAAIARIGSARSAVAAMVEPVTTVVLAAVILGEDVSVRIVAGAVLVISALPVLATSGTPRESAPSAEPSRDERVDLV